MKIWFWRRWWGCEDPLVEPPPQRRSARALAERLFFSFHPDLEERSRRGTCLRCSRRLPEPGKLVQECPGCGLVNTPGLRQRYWSLAPRLVILERLLKAMIVLGLAAAAVAFVLERPTGRALVLYVAGIPVAILLWATVAKLTRHSRYVAPDRVWTTGFWGVGLFLALNPETGAWPLILLLCGGIALWLGRVMRRWKARREMSHSSRDRSNTATTG